MSPHLAAVQATGSLPPNATDAAIAQQVRDWLDRCAHPDAHGAAFDAAIVETAGGVHSPAPSGTSQADVLRALRLPVVLIGSSQLGGISTTRAALESLHMRGYDVDAVLLFPSPRYQNDLYLQQLLRDELDLPVFAVGGPSAQGWGAPPVRAAHTADDVAQMRTYYHGLVHGTNEHPGLFPVVRHLRERHAARLAELTTLAPRTYAQCWWPFTQHTRYTPDDVMTIDSAHGDAFAVYDNDALRPMVDGSASWWTQCVGHAHPRLASAAAYAAGRYGHVLFPGAANAPALELTERLLGRTPHSFTAPGHWADRVFFSDDGSTGMEVALKMAIQSAVRRYDPQPTSAATHARIAPGREAGALGGRPRREWQVLGLQGSYHGDTIGAMDACEPSIYSEHVAWYRGRGQWLAPPTLHTRAGHVEVQVPASLRTHGDAPATATYASLDDVYDVAHRLEHDALAAHYRAALHDTLERLVLVEGHRFGALVLEPLVMGAGGMVFVDPLFQRVLIDVVRAREDLFAQRDAPLRTPVPHTPPHTLGAWRGLPVVFDEVFTGLFRLGFASAAEVLGTTPDIACYAKILSGGLVPLSVTLATDDIFATFASSPEKTHALLHGHSYTAHPVGCAVANETLTILDTLHAQGAWQPHQRAWGRAWSFWDRAWVEQLSHHERVASAMALGTVLKIELADAHQGYASNAAESLLAQLRTHGVHLRPLGNVIYVMCSLTTPADVLDAVQTRLLAALS